MVDIGQRGVDLDEDRGLRERVVLGRGGGVQVFVYRRRKNEVGYLNANLHTVVFLNFLCRERRASVHVQTVCRL